MERADDDQRTPLFKTVSGQLFPVNGGMHHDCNNEEAAQPYQGRWREAYCDMKSNHQNGQERNDDYADCKRSR